MGKCPRVDSQIFGALTAVVFGANCADRIRTNAVAKVNPATNNFILRFLFFMVDKLNIE
jgi:hypothetical protein